MSTGQMQQRNAQNVRLLSADLQPRYEPNFAWKSACSAFLALPALRGFWPMSSVDYAAASRARDVAGSSYHLTDNNTPTFGYDSLVPYVEFDGTNQYLSRADGGATNWADITGTETYIESTQRGVTLGGWFYISNAPGVANIGLMSKYLTVGNQRGYMIYIPAVDDTIRMAISINGIATVQVTGPVYTRNAWQFIVGRFEPSVAIDIFVDDTLTQQLAAVPATIFDNTADFLIASYDAGSYLLDGKASLCFLCAAYLSDAIILSLFHQTRAMYGV